VINNATTFRASASVEALSRGTGELRLAVQTTPDSGAIRSSRR